MRFGERLLPPHQHPLRKRFALLAFACAGVITLSSAAADWGSHVSVDGSERGPIEVFDTAGRRVSTVTTVEELSAREWKPGAMVLRESFVATPGEAIEVPCCAGRGRIVVDGVAVMSSSKAPVVIPITRGGVDATHTLSVAIAVSDYERRVACGSMPRVGIATRHTDGLFRFAYSSRFAARGGGQAVAYVPPGHDIHQAGALLVGTHPWAGDIWTYAAYSELLTEAASRDVVLIMPSGLGNSLCTEDAENEVMMAVDALSTQVAVDPRRVSIWGASMGGAGATTIAFHRPSRFASVTSFFGDCRYDLSTYARQILHDEAGARRVNALDWVENARNLPVWLIHGEDDRVSPIAQSELLADAMARRGFSIRFDRVAGIGHRGALVARYLREVVALAAQARAATD